MVNAIVDMGWNADDLNNVFAQAGRSTVNYYNEVRNVVLQVTDNMHAVVNIVSKYSTQIINKVFLQLEPIR